MLNHLKIELIVKWSRIEASLWLIEYESCVKSVCECYSSEGLEESSDSTFTRVRGNQGKHIKIN